MLGKDKTLLKVAKEGDEKPPEKKQIFRGMFRPRWEDIFNEIVGAFDKRNPGQKPESAFHRCQCGMLVQLHYLRDHWQQGHFDNPVYQDLKE